MSQKPWFLFDGNAVKYADLPRNLYRHMNNTIVNSPPSAPASCLPSNSVLSMLA